ncbi:MAG: hypothetical protein WBD25_13980, partial [Terriglobales bacterium]
HNNNPASDTSVESHPCAQNAQGWGTRLPFLVQKIKIKIKFKVKVKGSGQECPPHTNWITV